MIWKLREILAERNLSKIQRDWRGKGLSNIESSKKAIVLVSFEDIDSLKPHKIRNQLKLIALNIKLEFVTYIKNKKVAEAKTFSDDWFVLTSNDLSFGLEPRDIKRFSADLFLDFTSKPETPMLFLLLNSSARMRIGNRNEWNEKYLDFMIQADREKGIEYLAEQLVYYLQKINSNNNAA